MYKIVVDNRERKVFDELQNKCSYPYEIKTINIGDYVIMQGNTILYVVERKSWKDLAASIKDGRVDNHKKLIELRFLTGCEIILLIEGQAYPNVKGKIGNIYSKGLISHMRHTAIRDKFVVVQTRDKAHTITTLCALIDSHKTIKWNRYAPDYVPNNRYLSNVYYYSNLALTNLREYRKSLNEQDDIIGGGEEHLHIKNKVEPSYINIKMMSCIPKISFSMGTALYDKGYTLHQLLNFGKTDSIATMKHPSGSSYGEKVDESIRTFVCRSKELLDSNNIYPQKKTSITRDVRVQILAQIPSITEKTAVIILKKYTLQDLLECKSISLESIQISDKRKLGKAKSKTILDNIKYTCQV